jgi:uncharacterized protein YtpQ (UPF0354 family)
VQPDPSQVSPSLAEHVATLIRELDPKAEVEVDGPTNLSLQKPRNVQATLRSLRASCSLEPEKSEEHIDRFARKILFDGFTGVDEESILPMLKNQAWVEQVAARQQEKGLEPETLVVMPFLADLAVVLAEDAPDIMRPLVMDELEPLGLGKEAAFGLALHNLERVAKGFQLRQMAPGLMCLAGNDAYDASRVLLHPHWQELLDQVEGDLILAPIGRDLILFTGSENKDGLGTMQAILEGERSSPRAAFPVTTEVFRWTEAFWVPHSL